MAFLRRRIWLARHLSLRHLTLVFVSSYEGKNRINEAVEGIVLRLTLNQIAYPPRTDSSFQGRKKYLLIDVKSHDKSVKA